MSGVPYPQDAGGGIARNKGGGMPPTWRAKVSTRQRARAALNRPWLDDGVPDVPEPVAPDCFVDHPRFVAPTRPHWWHVYRIEAAGDVLIAEVRTESARDFVMARERWKTRAAKWKHESFESTQPLKPGA